MDRAALALILLLAPGTAGAQSVDEIVARYLEARGGIESLRAVQSLRMTGRMALSDIQADFVLELKRPAKMRTEITIEGRTSVQAFDGETAWTRRPLPEEPARLMAPDEAAEAKAQADVDLSPLVDSEAKGFTVELEGRETLPGGETWKLVVRGGPVSPRTLFLDTSTYHVVRTEDWRTVDGQEVQLVSEVGDYRSVDDLVFPHRVVQGPKDRPEERQRLEFHQIEVNPPLDDARFAMPRGGSP